MNEEYGSVESITSYLRKLGSDKNIDGMMRFGISGKELLGVTVASLRSVAKKIGKNHQLSLELWDTGIHELRILATITDEPKLVTHAQLEKWVSDLDSWDLCDQFCGNLAVDTSDPHILIGEWISREEEYVKRAGYALIAELAAKNRSSDDVRLEEYLLLIANSEPDERKYVKKAVNWALRQIGKRNLLLNSKARTVASKLKSSENRTLKWIGTDAYRELTGENVMKRLRKKNCMEC